MPLLSPSATPRDHGGERAHGRGRAEGVDAADTFRRRRRRRPDPGWGKPRVSPWSAANDAARPSHIGRIRRTRGRWDGDVALVQLDERTHRRDGHSVHERRVDGSRPAEERPELTRRRQGGRVAGRLLSTNSEASMAALARRERPNALASYPTERQRTPPPAPSYSCRARGANARAREASRNDGGGGLTPSPRRTAEGPRRGGSRPSGGSRLRPPTSNQRRCARGCARSFRSRDATASRRSSFVSRKTREELLSSA